MPDDLLGPDSPLTGFSLQTSHPRFIHVHRRTLEWIRRSERAGKPWVIPCDEPGDASHALLPDADDPSHDDARRNALWGTLLAGGAGNEWYFGYRHDHSDLTCQDWRSRDDWWDQCRIALTFFRTCDIPFWTMANSNHLVGNEENAPTVFCLADPGRAYVLFVYPDRRPVLDPRGVAGRFEVRWFEPRRGGALQSGSVEHVSGGSKTDLGGPPGAADTDWVVLLRAAE